MTLIKHTHRLWQSAEQHRRDLLCEAIWRWMVIAFIVAGFVGLPIALYVLWGKLT